MGEHSWPKEGSHKLIDLKANFYEDELKGTGEMPVLLRFTCLVLALHAMEVRKNCVGRSAVSSVIAGISGADTSESYPYRPSRSREALVCRIIHEAFDVRFKIVGSRLSCEAALVG